jgi:hypothetical protein
MRRLLKTITGTSLAALLLLLLLQWIPYTGIFLMILMAPMIAGLLVHVVLVSMFAEALTGRLPRVLALLPVAAYGGYYVLYTQQAAAITTKAAELRAANPRQVLAFDPAVHALVSSEARQLVSTHALPVAYQVSTGTPEGYLAHRLIRRDQCQIPRDTQGRVNVSGVAVPKGKSPAHVCLLSIPEQPMRRIITATRIEPRGSRKQQGSLREAAVRLESEGAVLGTYRTAQVDRLPRLPVIGIGCALNSGAARWDCFADFVRTTERIDATPPGADGDDLPESIMLGLRRYTAAELAEFRGHPQNEEAVARAGREAERVTDGMFALLEAVLSGGSPELPHNAGTTIAREPARLAPLAARMAERFIVLQAGPKGRERDAQLALLGTGLAALPAEGFAPIAGAAFAALRAGDNPQNHATLYLRAADFGRHALPFYQAQFRQRQTPTHRALPVLALCRIGEADPDTVAEMKTRILGPEAEKEPRYRTALFVALARFGEGDFLRANLGALSERHRDWMEAVLAGDGDVEGRPNNCMSHEWGLSGHMTEALQPSLMRLRGKWSRRPGVS